MCDISEVMLIRPQRKSEDLASFTSECRGGERMVNCEQIDTLERQKLIVSIEMCY